MINIFQKLFRYGTAIICYKLEHCSVSEHLRFAIALAQADKKTPVKYGGIRQAMDQLKLEYCSISKQIILMFSIFL